MHSRCIAHDDPAAVFAHVQACWDEARTDRLPARQAISPKKLARVLPYVSLIDVVAGQPLDFQYRLMGEHVIAGAGSNLVGRRSSELPQTSPERRPVFESFVRCVQTREPQRVHDTVSNMNGTMRQLDWMVWPLSQTGDQVDGLLAAALFQDGV
jgi:hypothetical protein